MSDIESKMKILIVDDEPLNLDIIIQYLSRYDAYKLLCARNGAETINLLKCADIDVDIILLDRSMPDIGGIEILKQIKKNPDLQDIPVIMQTARASTSEIAEGIRAGAYYYLTKPFEEDMLISIIEAAAQDIKQRRINKEEAKKNRLNFGMVDNCEMKVSSLEEVRKAALYLSHLYPDPENVIFGIHELILNAIEHGNLEIGYDVKTALLREGKWLEEIEKRRNNPKNIDKKVHIKYHKNSKNIELLIKDCGNGFSWCDYMEIDPHRALDNHGRGIATSTMCFDEMTYIGDGSEVYCVICHSLGDSLANRL